MTGHAWFRMYAEFVTDPKVQMMSEALQRRFIMLLCIRCGNDHVTLQDEEVAFQLRISNEDWAETKAVFLAKKLINEDNTPTAWDKRQYRSDSSVERVRKHRAKKKLGGNVTATPPDTDTDTESDNGLLPPVDSSTSPGGENAPPPATPPAKSQARGKSDSQGTRLPADWKLPKKWGDNAMEIRPDLSADDIRKEGEKFKDHFLALPGKEGRKADWEATWRNWIRREWVKPSGANNGGNGFTGPWFISSSAIEAKAKELGIEKQYGEQHPVFVERVLAKAGITPEMVRKARIDAGEKP